MTKSAGMLVLSLAIAAVVLAAQTPAPNPLPWAYGYVTPGPEPVPPPCPADAKPYTCSRPGRPWEADPALLRLPGSNLRLRRLSQDSRLGRRSGRRQEASLALQQVRGPRLPPA